MYPEIPGRNSVADLSSPSVDLFKPMVTAQVIKILSKSLQSWIRAHVSWISTMLS